MSQKMNLALAHMVKLDLVLDRMRKMDLVDLADLVDQVPDHMLMKKMRMMSQRVTTKNRRMKKMMTRTRMMKRQRTMKPLKTLHLHLQKPKAENHPNLTKRKSITSNPEQGLHHQHQQKQKQLRRSAVP